MQVCTCVWLITLKIGNEGVGLHGSGDTSKTG